MLAVLICLNLRGKLFCIEIVFQSHFLTKVRGKLVNDTSTRRAKLNLRYVLLCFRIK